MTQVKSICFCVLLFACSVYALKCGLNEMEEDCAADCPSDYCPISEGPVQSCPMPKNCPAPSCKCIFDYSRAANGSCIQTKDCPPFECTKPNEVYKPCRPPCSDDCSQATPSGECPPTFGFILIVLPCVPTCRCDVGYGRLDGQCVPLAQCPSN